MVVFIWKSHCFKTRLSEVFCLNKVVSMRIFPIGFGTFDTMILLPIPNMGSPHHTPPSNSSTPAGCPTTQLILTLLPGVASDPTVKGSVPESASPCPRQTSHKSSFSPVLLTHGCRSEVPTTSSFGLINLLDWPTECRELCTYEITSLC